MILNLDGLTPYNCSNEKTSKFVSQFVGSPFLHVYIFIYKPYIYKPYVYIKENMYIQIDPYIHR